MSSLQRAISPGGGRGAGEVVVVRSCWDYHRRPREFLAVLEGIVAAVWLENELELVRWNLSKTYLRDLEMRGVPTVPTRWLARLRAGELEALFVDLAVDEIVVKPVVGASAEGAFRLDRGSLPERRLEVESYFADRPLVAQPLAQFVLDEARTRSSTSTARRATPCSRRRGPRTFDPRKSTEPPCA